jgi:hypothetical protein
MADQPEGVAMPYPEMDDILLAAILQLLGAVILVSGLIGLAVRWLW